MSACYLGEVGSKDDAPRRRETWREPSHDDQRDDEAGEGEQRVPGDGGCLCDPLEVAAEPVHREHHQQGARHGEPASEPGQGEGECSAPGHQSLISQITAPLVTVAPTSAWRPVTVPALWALRGCSIFMASMTTMTSPSATSWPSSTATLTMVPCMGEVTASPEAAPPAFLADRFGLALPAVPPPAPPSDSPPSPAGRTTSRRRPPTSTVTFCRSPGSSGLGRVAGVGLDLVVELGLDPLGVDGELALAGRRGGADVGRVGDDGAVERDDGGHAVDDELVEGAARALERLGAVAAGDDELGDEGVERAGDGLALVVAAVEAHAGAGRGRASGSGCRGRA